MSRLVAGRFPKLRRLLDLKRELVQKGATPPTTLRSDLRNIDLKATFDMKFDVIHVNPPLQEYCRRAPTTRNGGDRTYWTWKEIVFLTFFFSFVFESTFSSSSLHRKGSRSVTLPQIPPFCFFGPGLLKAWKTLALVFWLGAFGGRRTSPGSRQTNTTP